MRRSVAIAAFLALVAAAGTASALDYGSVAKRSAILYDAPSLKARKLYVVSRYTPLELVVSLDSWVKVRDQSGALAWIEKDALSGKRYVVVTAALADVYQAPTTASPLAFKARQQVALEWVGDTNIGWIKVRHPDGAMGYIRATDVWGD